MRISRSVAPPRRPPRPPIRVELAGAVPALALRVAAGAAAALAAASLGEHLVVQILSSIAVAAWPYPGVAALLTGLAAYRLLLIEPSPATTATLVLTLHLLLTLTRLVARLPVTGWVEGRLLRAMLGPFLLIQAGSQALAALAFVAMSAMPVNPWLALPVIGGLVAVVLMLRRWLPGRSR